MTKKKIFLTGGNGFIGRNFIDKYKDKYNIYSPSHSELDLLNSEAVRKLFNREKFDCVLHTAHPVSHRAAIYEKGSLFRNTVQMFFNICDNIDKFDKMIFLSSGAIYDVSKIIMNCSEDKFGLNVPTSEGGYAKYICERHIQKLNSGVFHNKPKITSLRIFGVFGKYEEYSVRYISRAICRTLLGLPIIIDQERFIDYVYIDDMVKLIDMFIMRDKLKYNSYNITTGESHLLSEIAEKYIPESSYHFVKNGLDNEYTGSNKRLLEEFKKFKFADIQESIIDLYDWYAKQLEWERIDIKKIVEHHGN